MVLGFYDEAWRQLVNKYPLITRKIEELRCEAVAYEQYELEVEALRKDVKELQEKLAELNGLKRPVAVAAK